MSDRTLSRAELLAAFVLGALLSPQALEAKSLIPLEPCRIADLDGLVSTEARCGTLSVPEDPDDPDGPHIRLAVAVVPAIATKAKPDPLFLIAGGPGQGSIHGFAPLLGAFAGIRRERDLVMVDQRGTGDSNRLDCDMPDDALEGGEIPPAELRKLAKACLPTLPGRAQFYTTSIAVRDLDAVRAALGYPQVNVFGGSYGTRVAQHYARRFRSARARSCWTASSRRRSRWCRTSPSSRSARSTACSRAARPTRNATGAFPRSTGSSRSSMPASRRDAVAVTLADPVTGESSEIEVTRAHLVTMARMLTYSPGTASILPLVVHEAATNGNYGPLAAQAEMIGDDLERMIAMGMHNSVVCAEDAPRFAGAVDRKALEATAIGALMLDGMQAICEDWPRGPVDTDFAEPLDSAVPALLLSGEFDPATPASWGAMAAKGFRNGLHVVVPGQGHGQARLPCVQKLLRRFIDAGSVAGLDTACVGTIKPAPFFLSFSGSAP